MSGNERSSFLSMENLKRLGGMIENFVYDTYHLQLKDLIGFQEFQEILRDIMTDVESNGKQLSFLDKNKQVIVQVRDILLRIHQQIQAQVKEQAHTRPQSNAFKEIHDPEQHPLASMPEHEVGNYEMPAPIERMATQEEQPEAVFFKKLEELEQKRKAPPQGVTVHPSLPSHSSHPSHSIVPPIAPLMPSVAPLMSVTPFSQSIQASVTSAPAVPSVIVAMPPPPRKGMVHIISSWDRYIVDNPERSAVKWNIPLPSSIDPLGSRIAGIFLPASLSGFTPYVHMMIDGPGGNQTSCILAPEMVIGSKSRGWQRWSPMDSSLSYIKNISSPWMIYLRSADGALLPLGMDHFQITSIAVDITNRSATLKLASLIPSPEMALLEGEFQVGDQIWIYIKTEKKKTEVLSVSKDSIQVRYNIPTRSPTMSNAIHEWMNARILNYTRQWSMILDVTSAGDNSSSKT